MSNVAGKEKGLQWWVRYIILPVTIALISAGYIFGIGSSPEVTPTPPSVTVSSTVPSTFTPTPSAPVPTPLPTTPPVLSLTPTPTVINPVTGGPCEIDFENLLLNLINDERVRLDYEPVRVFVPLILAALAHVGDMAIYNYFDSTNPITGNNFISRLDAVGYDLNSNFYAELRDVDWESSQELFESWMNDRQYVLFREVIRDSRYTGIGIGCNEAGQGNDSNYYYSVVFGVVYEGWEMPTPTSTPVPSNTPGVGNTPTN